LKGRSQILLIFHRFHRDISSHTLRNMWNMLFKIIMFSWIHLTFCAYAPQQNEIVERKIVISLILLAQ